MTTTFREFLQERAAEDAKRAITTKSRVDEWRHSIDGLFAQFRSWLAASDPDGLIAIEETETELREEGLGLYRVPRLDLTAFGKWVGIIPKARNTTGTIDLPGESSPSRATGRVDITDETRRYILYRYPSKNGGDEWVIVDTTSRRPVELSREEFEKALMRYFR